MISPAKLTGLLGWSREVLYERAKTRKLLWINSIYYERGPREQRYMSLTVIKARSLTHRICAQVHKGPLKVCLLQCCLLEATVCHLPGEWMGKTGGVHCAGTGSS